LNVTVHCRKINLLEKMKKRTFMAIAEEFTRIKP